MKEIKKFLLFFWNLFADTVIKLKLLLRKTCDFFYSLFHKPPVVMSCEDTVKYILDTGCSVARFGDGEIKLIVGKNLSFQKASPELSARLSEVLSSDKKNLLICIPEIFSAKQRCAYTKEFNAHWKKHLSFFRKDWYRHFNPDRTYGNAFISRNYMGKLNKGKSTEEYYNYIKKLWDGEDIVIVEGEKSRLGMGNDLFDNASRIRRILCPSSQCFSKYGEILEEIKKLDRSVLVLLSLGPTASVLPLDLCNIGYRVIDIGNIDTEYEWFRMGADKKSPIKDKLVYEAGADINVAETVDDEKYNSEIISKIL